MLDTETRAAEVDTHPRPDRRAAAALLVAVVVLTVVWSLRSWEWSLVDDPDYRLSLLGQQEAHGFFGGMWDRAVDTYRADKEGGQFRPLLYVYAPVFYLLDVGPAHVVRLLMFLTALLAPVIWLARRKGSNALVAVWGLLLILAIPGFYEGLEFLSIMELPGMMFAGLGFVDRSDRRKVLWFLLAACCKSPMLGLLLAFALVLAYRRRWWLAATSGALGLGVLAVAGTFARGGTYTARYSVNWPNIIATLEGMISQIMWPGVVLLTGLLLLGSGVRALRLSEPFVTFALASLCYLAFLLPWGSQSGYNLAPPVYLGACAAIALVGSAVARAGVVPPYKRLVPALILAALPSLHVVELGTNGVLRRDDTARDTVAWLTELPPGTKVATNGLESAPRFRAMLHLRGHTEWTPEHLFWAPPGTPLSCKADFLIELDDQGASGVPDLGPLVKTVPLGRIYEIAPSAPCP